MVERSSNPTGFNAELAHSGMMCDVYDGCEATRDRRSRRCTHKSEDYHFWCIWYQKKNTIPHLDQTRPESPTRSLINHALSSTSLHCPRLQAKTSSGQHFSFVHTFWSCVSACTLFCVWFAATISFLQNAHCSPPQLNRQQCSQVTPI